MSYRNPPSRPGGGGGGAAKVLEFIRLFGNSTPTSNPEYGKAPGDVDWRLNVDPSEYSKLRYKPVGGVDKLAGNPTDHLNADWARQEEHFRQQEALAQWRAQQEAIQREDELRLKYAPGGYLEQEEAIKAKGAADKENQVREAGIMAATQGLLKTNPSYINAATAQVPPLTVSPATIMQMAYPTAQSLAEADVYKFGADSIFKKGTEAASVDANNYAPNMALKQRTDAAEATGKEIGNQEKLAGQHWWPYKQLGQTLLHPNGGYIGLNEPSNKPGFAGLGGGEGFSMGNTSGARGLPSPFLGQYTNRGIYDPKIGQFIIPKNEQTAAHLSGLFGGDYPQAAPATIMPKPQGATGGWEPAADSEAKKPEVSKPSIFDFDKFRKDWLPEDWYNWVPFGAYHDNR